MAKSIEEQYQELSDREHILHRPGMWLGSMIPETKNVPVLIDGEMVAKDIEYVPGMLKLIDEIISNSVDEYHRRKGNKPADRLTKIDVKLDSNGFFQCTDDGGIPVQMHQVAKCYVPEMIFGRAKAGSNFDDKEKRDGVGTNGVGSFITNCFSKRFNVLTSDGTNQLEVEWSDNALNKSDAKIKPSGSKFTTITAELDYARFKLSCLDYSFIKMVERKCIITAAANPGLKVTFNDEEFYFNNFKEYVDLYGFETIGEKNKDWEYYIASVPSTIGGQVYAIVNSAECNAGTHVHHADNVVFTEVAHILKKRHKIDDVRKNVVKSHTVVFINITVGNPAYDSQEKTKLTTDLGYAFYDDEADKKRWPDVSRKVKLKLHGSELIKMIADKFHAIELEKENAEFKKLAKENRKKQPRSVAKLVDATGTTKRERMQSELWLFEGQSAGAGFRTARKPKTQGCYFLKGKVKNTLHLRGLQIAKNKELNDICIALGLDLLNPDDLSKLRYSRVIIASDSDVDGHAINSLLQLFFIIHFPKLVEQGRIVRVIAPLSIARKGKDVKQFYNYTDYNDFRNSKASKGYDIAYFKGTGSLNKEDYKEMVRNPKFEKYTVDSEGLQRLKDWMGNNPQKRKELLSA